MKDILIVSNYYPPEKGAASNRIEQLALKLQQNGYRVAVLCPLGNYPYGKLFPQYRNKFSVTENRDGIRVKRLWIYPSNSDNIFKRVLSIMSFSVMLFGYLLFKKTPKKVIVQSPPLLLSFIAVSILKLKRKKIILNVSDLWPHAAIELGVLKPDSLSHRALKFIERFIYKHATVVLGQSREIISHVQEIAHGKDCYLYRNYPDHKQDEFSLSEHPKIKIFYAGLLGVAQGVYELCENIVLEPGIEFHIFGDGADKRAIVDLLRKHPHRNIIYHGMLERRELLAQLNDYDIAIVPLVTRIYGSVPSKIFEYGTLGFPILYLGGGEGEDIVNQHNLGWVVNVGNYSELNATLDEISKLKSDQLLQMKRRVFEESKAFNLELQVSKLIEQGVF